MHPCGFAGWFACALAGAASLGIIPEGVYEAMEGGPPFLCREGALRTGSTAFIAFLSSSKRAACLNLTDQLRTGERRGEMAPCFLLAHF